MLKLFGHISKAGSRAPAFARPVTSAWGLASNRGMSSTEGTVEDGVLTVEVCH